MNEINEFINKEKTMKAYLECCFTFEATENQKQQWTNELQKVNEKLEKFNTIKKALKRKKKSKKIKKKAIKHKKKQNTIRTIIHFIL